MESIKLPSIVSVAKPGLFFCAPLLSKNYTSHEGHKAAGQVGEKGQLSTGQEAGLTGLTSGSTTLQPKDGAHDQGCWFSLSISTTLTLPTGLYNNPSRIMCGIPYLHLLSEQ